MAHTHITIDGETVCNTNLDQWQQRPPHEIQQLLQPGNQPTPGMKALLIAFAEAAATNQPLTANLTTREHGYTLDVTTTPTIVKQIDNHAQDQQ